MNKKLSDQINLREAAEQLVSDTPEAELVHRSVEELLHELQVHQVELDMQNNELRRTYDILEKSHNRYAQLYDFSPVGFIVLNPEEKITELNLTTATLLGIERKKLLAQRFSRWVAPQDSDRWYLFFTNIIKQERRSTIELTLKDFNNKELPVQLICMWIDSMLHITLIDSSKIKQIEISSAFELISINDADRKLMKKMQKDSLNLLQNIIIAERKQIEKIRTDSLTRLQNISSSLPGVIYQYRLRPDGSSYFPYASAAMLDLYHLSPKEVEEDASKAYDLVHPEDLEKFKMSVQESARNLSPWYHEYRIKFNDGTVRWLSGSSVPQREADGSILWHGFSADITQRKHIENTLHLDNVVLNAISQGVLVATTDQNITWVNDAFLSITGYTRADILGHNCRLLQGERSDQATIKQMRQALKTLSPFSGEILNYRKDGSIFWNELNISPVFDQQGQLTNFISTCRDISERKELEEKLCTSNAFVTSIINSLTAHIAVLDESGVIIAVNTAWEQFSKDNGLPESYDYLLGYNYLEACKSYNQTDLIDSREARNGIEAVLAGKLEIFDLDG